MAPGFFEAWRAERRLRRSAESYLRALLDEPDHGDVEWLTALAADHDADRARWELRYARRALGLLSAERDALDDRTGSAVARALSESLRSDKNVAAGMIRVVERQFNARLREYGDALGARNSATPAVARLGRALLSTAGIAAPSGDDVSRATELMSRELQRSNEALRAEFGTASLPENIPPSAAQSGTSAGR
jgi:hypothetical protein